LNFKILKIQTFQTGFKIQIINFNSAKEKLEIVIGTAEPLRILFTPTIFRAARNAVSKLRSSYLQNTPQVNTFIGQP